MNFAICVNNSGYPASLELHKTYRLLPDDAAVDGDLRVTDESGEDYLYPYPADYFLLLEFPQDTEWVLRDSFLRRLQPAAV